MTLVKIGRCGPVSLLCLGNKEYLEKRTLIADQVLADMIRWLGEGEGRVGILDASNTQPARRLAIWDALRRHGIELVFLECINASGTGHEQKALAEHIRELRLTNPEYATAGEAHVLEDFTRRLEFYRPYYVPVGSVGTERNLPYITSVNGGQRLEANRVQGYLRSRMFYYLMNLHHGVKRIYLCVLPTADGLLGEPGETTVPVQRYFHKYQHAGASLPAVWTETSLVGFSLCDLFVGHRVLTKPQLRGRDLGVLEGLQGEGLDAARENKYPDEFAAHQKDPYYHRYPRAESYHDVAVRLENVIMELEKTPDDVIIMADRSVLQCIYAYFREIPNREIPAIDIPLRGLLEIRAKAYGIFERRIKLGREDGPEIGHDLFHSFAENL